MTGETFGTINAISSKRRLSVGTPLTVQWVYHTWMHAIVYVYMTSLVNWLHPPLKMRRHYPHRCEAPHEGAYELTKHANEVD